MKIFYTLLFLAFLTSCGEAVIENTVQNSVIQQDTVEKTSQDVSVALSNLPEIDSSTTKVVELSTTYISPKTEVIMNISYTLTDDDLISDISVTSPNYKHMYKFDNGIQDVIGMNIEDAAKYHVSGSSLGTVAFQEALKNL